MNDLAVAVLAPLALLTFGAHAAGDPLQPQSVVTTDAVTTVTYSFSGLTFAGFEFQQVGLNSSFNGSLTSVSVNATLDASNLYTYADDLTIYVDPLPLSDGGLLQVGGFSNLSAAERHSWANGGDSAPGTTVIDSVTLTTPINFNGTSSNPAIWLGNGYGDPDADGTWTGSIRLNFTTAVPEPSSWALFALGGAGLAAWSARRRRSAAQPG